MKAPVSFRIVCTIERFWRLPRPGASLLTVRTCPIEGEFVSCVLPTVAAVNVDVLRNVDVIKLQRSAAFRGVGKEYAIKQTVVREIAFLDQSDIRQAGFLAPALPELLLHDFVVDVVGCLRGLGDTRPPCSWAVCLPGKPPRLLQPHPADKPDVVGKVGVSIDDAFPLFLAEYVAVKDRGPSQFRLYARQVSDEVRE
jgi:hypothetical protein